MILFITLSVETKEYQLTRKMHPIYPPCYIFIYKIVTRVTLICLTLFYSISV